MSEFVEKPVLELQTDHEDLHLTWDNTTVHTYPETYRDCWHIRFRHENGSTYWIRLPIEMLDMLFERDYPSIFQPLAEEEVLDWAVDMGSQDVGEIERFANE